MQIACASGGLAVMGVSRDLLCVWNLAEAEGGWGEAGAEGEG